MVSMRGDASIQWQKISHDLYVSDMIDMSFVIERVDFYSLDRWRLRVRGSGTVVFDKLYKSPETAKSGARTFYSKRMNETTKAGEGTIVRIPWEHDEDGSCRATAEGCRIVVQWSAFSDRWVLLFTGTDGVVDVERYESRQSAKNGARYRVLKMLGRLPVERDRMVAFDWVQDYLAPGVWSHEMAGYVFRIDPEGACDWVLAVLDSDGREVFSRVFKQVYAAKRYARNWWERFRKDVG